MTVHQLWQPLCYTMLHDVTPSEHREGQAAGESLKALEKKKKQSSGWRFQPSETMS